MAARSGLNVRFADLAVAAAVVIVVVAAGLTEGDMNTNAAFVAAVSGAIAALVASFGSEPITWAGAVFIGAMGILISFFAFSSLDVPLVTVAASLCALLVVAVGASADGVRYSPAVAIGPVGLATELLVPSSTLVTALAVGGIAVGVLRPQGGAESAAPAQLLDVAKSSEAPVAVGNDVSQHVGPVSSSDPPYTSASSIDNHTFGDVTIATVSQAGRRTRKGGASRSVDHAIVATASGQWAVVVLAATTASAKSPHVLSYWACRVVANKVAKSFTEPIVDEVLIAKALDRLIVNAQSEIAGAVKLVTGSTVDVSQVLLTVMLVPPNPSRPFLAARNHEVSALVVQGDEIKPVAGRAVFSTESSFVDAVDLSVGDGRIFHVPGLDPSRDDLERLRDFYKARRLSETATLSLEIDASVVAIWPRSGATTVSTNKEAR